MPKIRNRTNPRRKPARRNRVSRIETLERRQLLAAAVWHNVLVAQDVNGNGEITANDALVVINELGQRRHSDQTTGTLADQVEDVQPPPHYDVNCDGRATAIDALNVINHLQVPGRAQRFDFASSQSGSVDGNFTTIGCHAQLNEGSSLITELSTAVRLPNDSSGVLVRFDAPQFDTSSIGRMQDAFEITITDEDGNHVTQPYSPSHSAVVNWSEQTTVAMGSATSVQDDPDASDITHEVIINLAHLDADSMVNVALRLLNNDGDDTTSVLIRDVEAVDVAEQPPLAFESEFVVSRTTDIDFDELVDVSPSFKVDYGRSSFMADDNEVASEVTLTNLGQQTITGNLIGAFDRFTDADLALMPPDGFLPDGRPFYDFTELFDEQLATDESTAPRTLRFFNPGDERFEFRLSLLAGVNRAPSEFTSTPLEQISASDTFRYDANADDPDGDGLTYSVASGPEGLQVDGQTGSVVWETAAIDVGNHNVILQATDTHGLSSAQAFTVQVIEDLQNRPPNFVSDPVTGAIASSGFEITTVATGDSPADVVAISGFQGPRLVSINAGDQTVSVHAGENNDRFDDLTVYSTGEPRPTDALFDVGYNVDVGLPAFRTLTDNNDVPGIDQGDFNGDGILDLVTMTFHRRQTALSGASDIEMRIVRMLGDGNGNFSPPEIIASVDANTFDVFRNLITRDINGDGNLDVMAMQLGTSTVFSMFGNGDGSFQALVTTEFEYALDGFRLVDLDQDGNLDVVGNRFDEDRALFWKPGIGDGTFRPAVDILPIGFPAAVHNARPYDVADLDGDGDQDIVVARSAVGEDAGVNVLLNDGNQQFSVAAVLRGDNVNVASAVYAGDFTGDGAMDVVAGGGTTSNSLFLFVGDGSGTNFVGQRVAGIFNRAGNWSGSDGPADVDGDGDLDLALASVEVIRTPSSLSPQILINDGSGDFSSTYYPMLEFDGDISEKGRAGQSTARGVMFGDYNSDGLLDYVYSTSSPDFNGVGIRLGTRPGEFGGSRSIPFTDIRFTDYGNNRTGDFNGDGILDLLAPLTRETFLGNGDGTFAEPFPAAARGGTQGSAVADFNLDGLPDFVSTGTGYYVGLNNGNGTFEISDEQPNVENVDGGYTAVRVADFNNDGFPDFMGASAFTFGGPRPYDVYLNDPDNPGTFERSFRVGISAQGVNVSGYQHSLTVGDFNEDGNIDFAAVDLPLGATVGNGEGQQLVIYAGDGQGDFSVLSESSPYPNEFFGGEFPFFYAGDLDSGDVNEDGHLDIVSFTIYGPLIHLGNGDGSFETTDFYPYRGGENRLRGNYLADIDEDGHLDMVHSLFPRGLLVERGNGDGTFQVAERIAALGRVADLNFADVDHDGHLDIVHAQVGLDFDTPNAAIYAGVRDGLVDTLAVDLNGDGNEEVLAINEHNDRLKLFVGDNLGGLTRQPDLLAGRAPKAVTAADLNGDGQLELITANRAGRSLSVFSGSIDGGYSSEEFALPGGAIDLASADLDGDGNVDVVALDDADNALWVYAGNGTATLATPTAIPLGDRPTRFVLEDATGDGLLDAVITLPDTDRLMILSGIGFQPVSPPLFVDLLDSPSDVAVVDLNDDGNPDLAATLPDSNVLSVLYGRGNNQFAKAQQIRVGQNPTRVSLTDADEDGRTDLIVTNSGDSTASVIYNRFDPNEVYRYDANAIDPDGDTLAYDIADGPGGLIINPESGELLWAASPDQVGVHDVTISVDDGRGGVATQTFKIDVQSARENAAPLIATQPPAKLGAGEIFSYQASALDNDRDSLRYRLIDGPEGATLDPTTGELIWDGRDVSIEFLPNINSKQLEAPASPSLNPDSITVEGWYNLNELPRFHTLMFQEGRIFGGAYSLVTRAEEGILQFIMAFETETLRINIPYLPELDRWRHYAFTYDHTTGVANFYLDGVLGGTGSVAPQPIALDPTTNTRIAHTSTHARIDNYRIWNYARSPEEIQEGLARQYDGDERLVLDYRFDDLPTRNVRDASPAQNQGYRIYNDGLEAVHAIGLTDPGIHSFTIEVEDGRGGFDTQSFDLEVLPELRGSIIGHLFDDLNGDGDQDDGTESPAEPSLEGWQLYLDLNDNAYPDPSEPQAISDGDGNYRFDGLLPGVYPLRVTPTAGYERPAASDVAVAASAATELDFAIEQLALSHIRGRLATDAGDDIANWKVFADLNNDGLRGENEPMATSDRDGNFALIGLAAGDYTIRPDLPAGWVEADGADGLNVNLLADQVSTDNDFVLVPTNASVTGGVHFLTAPQTDIVARDTFRYASIAVGISDESISYDVALGPDGLTIDANTGLVAWRPTINQVGEHSVVLRATSESGSISLHDFTLNVAAPNTAPTIVSLPPGTSYQDTFYTYDVVAQDSESVDLIYAIESGPAGATIDANSGRLTYLPTAADLAGIDFTVSVTDQAGSVTSAIWNVIVESSAPAALPLSIQLARLSAVIGRPYVGRASGTDALDRSVNWSLDSGPNGLSVDADGTLRWTPTTSQLGEQLIQLTASTADGESETVSLAIEVNSRETNQAPVIDSTPVTSVSLGNEFQYDVMVSDGDRDIHAFELLQAPAGMSIHPSRGTVRWTPETDQLGEATVVVQVSDPIGAVAIQEFTVDVSRFGGPPRITSVPPTEASVGNAFLYSVDARDAEGDPLAYMLLTAPVGMSIVETTGEISWTPAADQEGQRDVVIQVSDGIGGAVTQAFSIRVSAGAPNLPPEITSIAPRFGAVGEPFIYSLQATDPESSAVRYSIGRGPVGMTIDEASGAVSWIPTAAQTGKHVVTLIATDVGGAAAVESFEFDVLAANIAPEITSEAPLETVAGAPFRYDVLVRDENSDPVTFELTTAPAGVTIDAFGRITWETSVAQIGQHDFAIVVADPRGGSDTQSFTLDVIEDTVPPKVSLIVSPSPGSQRVLPWMGPFTAYVKAVDNVAVQSLTLAANGQEIRLDASGTATFTFEDWGFADIIATATAVDTNGNTTTKQTGFNYGAPLGWNELGDTIPTAEIVSPADSAAVTGMVRIDGTAAHDDFASYTLSYRQVDDTVFTQFHESTAAVTDGELGVWDTSLLLNDEYVIRLEVTTTDNVVNIADHNVGLGGNLKLGNFRLSFTDLIVPVAGIPIELTRIYDTLHADRQGDFGQGWRLEYRNTDLKVGLPESGLEDIGIHTPFRGGVKVYLNVPGEGRQGFTFTPEIRVLPGLGGNLVLGRPRFTPDYGVTSTLSTGVSNYLLVNEQGEFFAGGQIPYNPASPHFDGAYKLTTADGTEYSINGETGLLSTATDRNGNSITFTEEGIVSESGVGIDFQRDSLGRIIQMTDPVGNEQSYRYDAEGNLAEHIDPEGNVTTYTYEADHRLQEVTDPLGRVGSRSEYDTDGRLISFTGADGRRIDLSRDLDTLQELITDGLGNTTVVESDNNGNIVRVTDELGGVTSNTYDADGNQTSSTNTIGETTHRKFDANRNVIELTDPTGATSTFTFNSSREVTSSTDALGRTSHFEYDDSGNLTRIVDAAGAALVNVYDDAGKLLSTTDAAGNSSRFEYDASGFVTAEIDKRGQRTANTYDANGNLLSTTDPLANTTHVTVDGNGDVTSITNPLGHTTSLGYDALGIQVSETDPLGNITRSEFDGNGNVRREVDAFGNERTRDFDAANNLTEITNERDQTTRYEYDALSRFTKIIDPQGAETEIVYDAAGRVLQQIDALGNITTFGYDGAGRNTHQTDALGHTIEFQYDSVGNLVAEIDPEGNQTTFDYDALDRLIRTIHPDGGVEEQTYDLLGNLISVADAFGNEFNYEYDANSNLVKVANPVGETTTFAYDANNRLLEQNDALGRKTQYQYDGNGQRILKTFPDGNVESNSYDVAGRLESITDANGDTTIIDTNALGQVIGKTFEDGTEETFTFTPTGNIETATNANGTVSYQYDGADRLERVTYPDGNYVAYQYDAGGNRTQVETNVGTGPARATIYTFDELNRVETVTDADGQVTQYSYDSRGNLLVTAKPNGVNTDYTYDSMNRISSLSHTHGASVLQAYEYTYNLVGDRILTENNDGSRVEYQYDANRQLVTEIRRDALGDVIDSSRYVYDVVGNRITLLDQNGATIDYIYNDNDQLVSFGDTTLVYDNNGNLVTRTEAGETTNYQFDFENHLVEVNAPAGQVFFGYDASGERVSRTEQGDQVNFLVDLNNLTGVSQVLVEYNASDTTLAEYTYGAELIGQDRAGVDHYHHFDAGDNVRFLTDGAGNVTDSYDYTAFGVELETTGTTENAYRFAGQRYGSTEDLSYLRARSYDAQSGRFISRDPFEGILSDPISLHRYLYANSNPVSFRDPTGLFSLAELGTASTIIGNIQTNYASALANILKTTSEIADDYIVVGAKGREIVLNGLSQGVFSPGLFRLYQDSNTTISNGFKLIGRSAAKELVKFGFSLFSPASTLEHTISKGKFKGLDISFDAAGILGDIATTDDLSKLSLSTFVPALSQLKAFAGLAKSTASITEKAVRGESVPQEARSQAINFLKDVANAF